MKEIKVIINDEQFNKLIYERLEKWLNNKEVINGYYNYLKEELNELFNIDERITIDINDTIDKICINDTYYYTFKDNPQEYKEGLQYKNDVIKSSQYFTHVLYIDKNIIICI